MNKENLKKLVREELEKALKENQPATKPSTRPGEKEVHPGTPPTEKPRRTLRPEKPGVVPKHRPAKAMYEGEHEDIINKIVQRFKGLK
jgi:hypothetical protein